jgi:outer membrane immunogenic protein
MRRVLTSTAAAIFSTAAFAADFPLPVEPIPQAVVAPAFSWSGFYVGASGGWGWSDDDVTYEYLGDFDPAEIDFLPTSADVSGDGPLAGGTVGFNAQYGWIVAGVEGDFSWADINGSDTFSDVFDPAGLAIPVEQSSELSMDWFATARGRLGIAAGNFLIFGTAGAAFADVTLDSSFLAGGGANGDAEGSEDEVATGWTAGGGVELALGERWSVKGEALYYDLGDISVTLTDPAIPTRSIVSSTDLTGVIARGGINFRF